MFLLIIGLIVLFFCGIPIWLNVSSEIHSKKIAKFKSSKEEKILSALANDTWEFPVCELYSKHKYKELPCRKSDITKIKNEIIKILETNKIPSNYHSRYEDNWKELWEKGKNIFEQDNLVLIQKAREYKQKNQWSEAGVLYKKLAKEEKSLETLLYSQFCEYIAQLVFENATFDVNDNMVETIEEFPKKINDNNIDQAMNTITELYKNLVELIDSSESIINVKDISVGNSICKISFAFSKTLSTIAETNKSNKDISVSCYEKSIMIIDTVLRKCYVQTNQEIEFKELMKQHKNKLYSIEPSKSVKTKNIDKEKIITAVIGIIIVLIIIKIAVGAGGNHHSKWSELSKEEQDNARWAYQVQEEIKNRQ